MYLVFTPVCFRAELKITNHCLCFIFLHSMQDCADTDPAPCGGIPSDELTLFDDAEACCSEKLSWLSLEVCVANTNGVAPVGTNAWYVDWTLLKCVQDCDGTAPCGGLKGAFDTVYGDSTKCCARISWVDPTECVLA
jgi:hypothetical protein